ncbi:hypothetical protein K4H01_26370, partial [Mycobacterium tuberculosis]|nr:hypothetical protein [Mycobacterium tuberculosis]
AALNDPGHPAVTALIRHVVDTSRKLGLDVSLCGDMGGDPQHLPALIGAGGVQPSDGWREPLADAHAPRISVGLVGWVGG